MTIEDILIFLGTAVITFGPITIVSLRQYYRENRND